VQLIRVMLCLGLLFQDLLHKRLCAAPGSCPPAGLLQFFIDKFSLLNPDYKQRVLRHGECVKS
jgi:hypothetical protein